MFFMRRSCAVALQILPQLEQFGKVILWFGGDSRKWQSARHFARKLNEKRCFLIRCAAFY